jgi:hypothetical protein
VFGSAIPDAAILATDLGAQGSTSLQNLMARAVESFRRAVFKQFLCGFVPGTNLTHFGDRKSGVRRSLQQTKELKFQHDRTPAMGVSIHHRFDWR